MPDHRPTKTYETPPGLQDSAARSLNTWTHTGGSRRRSSMIKLGLGCSGLAMTLCAGGVMFVVILLPVLFQGLDHDTQDSIVRRVPFMATFQFHPTAPFNSLPTYAPTSENALALLSTPISSLTPRSAGTLSGSLSSGDSGGGGSVDSSPQAPTIKPAATIPAASTVVAVVPTATAAQFTSILASDTPVPANVQPSATPVAPTLVPTSVLPTFAAPTIAPTATDIPVPVSFHNDGFKWVPQKWNNCGPANITQALAYYGWPGSQLDAAAYLKPNTEDKNVSPWQLVDYVNNKTKYKAITRMGGNFALLKLLVSRKFAVLLETGYNVAGEGWMGHYLTVVGYDEPTSVIYGFDTFMGVGSDGQGMHEKYDDLDQRWQQFNRVYLVIYPQERELELAGLLGQNADLNYNYNHALDIARAEAKAQPDNQFAWFNVGTSFTLLKQYKEAATAFDQASNVGGGLPFRFLWYQFYPFEAYYNAGNYNNVMALVSANLKTTTDVEETYYWRAMVEKAQNKTADAVSDFKRVLTFNQNFTPAAEQLALAQNGTTQPGQAAQ